MSNPNGYPDYVERNIAFADNPETKSRARRWEEFQRASGLTEIPGYPPPKHRALINEVERSKMRLTMPLDHPTYFELGNMAILMAEPYHTNLEDYTSDKIYVVEVPFNIALWCGGWRDELGEKPGTKCFLITSILKKRQLDEISARLNEAAKKLPPWNYIGEDDK